MDNATIHKPPEVLGPIKNHGHTGLFVPPYYGDFVLLRVFGTVIGRIPNRIFKVNKFFIFIDFGTVTKSCIKRDKAVQY
jgi:hypothetical protein